MISTHHALTDWNHTQSGHINHMYSSFYLLVANHSPWYDLWQFLANLHPVLSLFTRNDTHTHTPVVCSISCALSTGQSIHGPLEGLWN